MQIMSYAIGALFFVGSLALLVFAGLAQAYSKPVVSEPIVSDAPDYFCPTIGCRYMAQHEGCCGECDICAVFGSHKAPVYDYSMEFEDEYAGKHRNDNPSRADYYYGKHHR